MKSSAPRTASDDGVIEAAMAALGDMIVETKQAVGEVTLTVRREAVAEACRLLRDTPGLEYQQLMEIAGVDYPERAERFEVVYHLLSVTKNRRIRVKAATDEETPVPTVTTLWPVAGWLEREVFDMYGVRFSGNADLRRILTDYGFEGHPQRKDFPLTGFVELRYSETEKRVVYEPVKLAQDFRTFDFLMPWDGPEYQLPGDEKAEPQAPGAPSPPPAPTTEKVEPKAPPPTPKTTEKPSDTGAGAPTDAKAKAEARKPAEDKADRAGGRDSGVDKPEPGEGKGE